MLFPAHNRATGETEESPHGLLPPVQPGELCERDLRPELASFELHRIHKIASNHFRIVHFETGEGHKPSRGTYLETWAGHLGYAVHEQHRGHRYAARALDPVWITCDPANQAPQRTLEVAGAEFVETVDLPADTAIFQSGARRKCRYKLSV